METATHQSKPARVTDDFAVLAKTIPEMFSSPKTSHSIARLYRSCAVGEGGVENTNGRGYLAKLLVRGGFLTKLGFPADEVMLTLDRYADQAWCFSVQAEVRDVFQFSLEWDSDIKPEKNKIAASRVKIYYRLKTAVPPIMDYEFRAEVGKPGKTPEKALHETTEGKVKKPGSFGPRITISGNTAGIHIGALPNIHNIHPVNLKIPICVHFTG